MRLLAVVLIGGLIAAGCRGSAARTSRERLAEAYDYFRPFERARLEPFASDSDLHRYLDTVAFIDEHRRAEPSATTLPSPPQPPPDRMRPPGPNPSTSSLSYRALLGIRSFGPAWRDPARLVQRDGRVYSLYANRLRSFEIVPASHTLRLRSELTLGAPLPVPKVEDVQDSSGVVGRRQIYADGAFNGVAIFDYLFAIEGELVVVGNRQDLKAIEIVRVAVGSNGELHPTGSQLIHYLPPELDGYRARVAAGALILYLPHTLFYEDRSNGKASYVYTLPAIGDGHSLRVLLHGKDVYHPLVHSSETQLHTLVRCDLTSPALDCSARAIPGPSAAAVHVASDAVYVWLVGWRREPQSPAGSFIYRMPLDGSEPGAVRLLGAPPPSNDGVMHVDAGHFHAIARGEARDQLVLMRVPLGAFSSDAPMVPAQSYRTIRAPTPGTLDAEHAEFVEHHLIWGSKGDPTGYFLRYKPSTPNILLVPLAGGVPSSVFIGHSASRVCDLGDYLLVMGTDGWHLHYSMVDLTGSSPRVVTEYVMRDAVPKLARHGSAFIASTGEDRWLAADVALLEDGADPKSETRLPLRWSPRTTTLEPGPLWSVPLATRSPLQPFGSEILQLGGGLTAIRLQDQLLLYHFVPQPKLTQRIALGP